MADSTANAANQTINTTQPKPLRGLQLRGNRVQEEVLCVTSDGRTFKVAKKNFDPKIHKKAKASRVELADDVIDDEDDNGGNNQELIPTKKRRKKKKSSE